MNPAVGASARDEFLQSVDLLLLLFDLALLCLKLLLLLLDLRLLFFDRINDYSRNLSVVYPFDFALFHF